MKLNKPQLTIRRVGEELHFQTIESDLKEFDKDCYSYQYTYTKCNKVNPCSVLLCLIIQDQIPSILTTTFNTTTLLMLKTIAEMENESVHLNNESHFKHYFSRANIAPCSGAHNDMLNKIRVCISTYIFLLCLQNVTANGKMIYIVQFDPACKYTARVQILFSKTCGSGGVIRVTRWNTVRLDLVS